MKKIYLSASFPIAISPTGSRLTSAMQCDLCEKKATVFFTQIIDGVTKKSNLCDACATEQGVTDPDGFLLGSADISSPVAPQHEPADSMPSTSPSTMENKNCCPSCGFAFDDLKKTGRLGCSDCYQFFREEIKHNLTGMHKGTSHSGRVPEGMLAAFQNRQQLEALEKAMAAAIDAEDYEKAASVRDQITQVQQTESTVKDISKKDSDKTES